MSDTVESYLLRRHPTAARPLLGLTVLTVEDSRFASEAVRLMCLRSGARIRRADCLASAAKHLRTYRPSVVIVDLGLPDGNGEDLIRELVTGPGMVQVVLATSGDLDGESRAMEAGAMGFLEKPVRSIAGFQQAILAHLPPESRPLGLRVPTQDRVSPDRIAFRDDMAHVVELLSAPGDDQQITYIAQFTAGVARAAEDSGLLSAAEALAAAQERGASVSRRMMQLRRLIEERIAGQAIV